MKIAVIGSGAWGTALALVAHRAGNNVRIWSRNHEVALEINNKHSNHLYLPSVNLPKDISATTDLNRVLDSDAFFLTVPAQNIRQLCEELAHLNISREKILIVCAKGIEQESLKLMSEVIEEILPKNPVAILSGPNFALEIAKSLPAISTIAVKDMKLAKMLASSIGSANFRVYPNDDIIATQIIGAAKNVLAIANGIVMGKNLGENAKSAIFSRGISEIKSLIIAKNGKISTLFSPAGIGDLNLTCNSPTSRNTSFGIALAQGKDLRRTNLVEGFYTSSSILSLAKKLEVEVPVMDAVYKIVHQNQSIDNVITELLERPVKQED
jgi:glycerol-3-phosphate dehydrogenase (NAD(P)+)